MPRPIRTFIAVDIPDDVASRAHALIERLRAADAKVSWIAPESMHMTLKFLGDVVDREIPEICAAVARAASRVSAFELQIEGAGAYPDRCRPRTLWLGASAGNEQMATLHDEVERELAPLGYRGDGRRFQPHLTLGRVREQSAATARLAALLEKNQAFEAGVMYVEEAIIYSSERSAAGSTYDVLGRADLRREWPKRP